MRIAVFALLALLVGCCSPAHSPEPQRPYLEPVATLSFDADQSFSPQERAWIRESAERLAIQTNGYIKIEVAFDLNFWDDESLSHAYGRDILLKVSKEDEPATDYDAESCCLLGLTRRWDDLAIPMSVYLVVDRIAQLAAGSAPLRPDLGDEHRLFVSVTMHEFLHALGVPHVEDPRALMAASAQLGDPITLQRADYDALCRVWACSVHRVSNGRF